jgi:[acyl-carrier-protein] S-malonyltransferase
LAPWLELPGLRQRAEALSDAAKVDLVAHGTTSDAETIRDTAVAQPLIVGAGLLALEALYADGSGPLAATVFVVAGHSVGELTAAASTGVLEPDAAMSLVSVRASAMAEASAAHPTGMSAVLGGDPDEVLAILDRHGLTAANMNGAGQIVAAGTLEQLEALVADPPPKSRVIPLQVAGAFHTVHMSPAVEVMRAAAADHDVSDPGVTLLSNADGAAVASGREFLNRLVTQISHPVRWDRCMQTMTDLQVTHLIELAPAGTLVGLAKRAMKGVQTVALKTPDDLPAARQLLSEAVSSSASTPGWAPEGRQAGATTPTEA